MERLPQEVGSFLTIDPTGKFVYVTNNTGNMFQVTQIDPTTGILFK